MLNQYYNITIGTALVLPCRQVHVACAYQSRMLFNADDIQGGGRVRRLAKWGLERTRSSVAAPQQQQQQQRGGSAPAAAAAAAAGGAGPGVAGSSSAAEGGQEGSRAGRSEGPSIPISTLTERASEAAVDEVF